MRWTRQRFARDGIAGRVGERPVSDQQRADERCCSVRRSRVVLTPRRWRQVRGVASAQPGLDKTISAGDGGKRARSPGRARRKPLKPLRAGMPGDSGVLVVTRVRSTTTNCTRGRGCNGHPAFPTPSLGGRFINASGASRGEVANACLDIPRSQPSSGAQRSNPAPLRKQASREWNDGRTRGLPRAGRARRPRMRVGIVWAVRKRSVFRDIKWHRKAAARGSPADRADDLGKAVHP